MPVVVRPFLSPTLVLLAFDWSRGESEPDFLGFAIKRSPGFYRPRGMSRALESWLPNRLTFDGAVPPSRPDAPSRSAPIQKFMWWDARIEPQDRNGQFIYTVYPVVGTPAEPKLLEAEAGVARVTLPDHVEGGIGTWFNRAVLSSQAFNRQLAAMRLAPGSTPTPEQALALREWLANDLQLAFGEVLRGASKAVSAVYHLTDSLWVRPQLKAFAHSKPAHSVAIVHDAHGIKVKGQPAQLTPNADAIAELRPPIDFYGRDKTAIMHNKFIVTDGPNRSGRPSRVLTGSANFTTGGLTTQANLLHVSDSAPLAEAYNQRAAALAGNPTKAKTAGLAAVWSPVVELGSARIRLSFSPEPRGQRAQTDTIVEAIASAKRSVLFCLFTPTDRALRQACFAAADRGLMMFGLINRLAPASAAQAQADIASGRVLTQPQLAALELFHRSRKNRDVIDGRFFSPATVPSGFEPELQLFPGEEAPSYAPVVIHHKFVVIDAEDSNPVIYTGSANMSENSQHNNDENVLELRHPATAGIYLAEFMRLYEHYRARALAIRRGDANGRQPLKLSPNRAWADKYYVAGSPEAKARVAMSQLAT